MEPNLLSIALFEFALCSTGRLSMWQESWQFGGMADYAFSEEVSAIISRSRGAAEAVITPSPEDVNLIAFD